MWSHGRGRGRGWGNAAGKEGYWGHERFFFLRIHILREFNIYYVFLFWILYLGVGINGFHSLEGFSISGFIGGWGF